VILPPLVFPGSVDPLVQISSDQLGVCYAKRYIFLSFFTKLVTLTRRSTVLSLAPLVFPAHIIGELMTKKKKVLIRRYQVVVAGPFHRSNLDHVPGMACR
jgi:hypothetical protein